jgi:hypothetical protein
MRYTTAIALSGCLALSVQAISTILFAQIAPSSQPSAQPPPPPPYRPGLGDLMTMTVQPRHLKLGIAGRENNWVFAAYEFHELEESFERVARYWPQWRRKPIAEMITSVTKDPMTALDQAIKAADAAQFTAVYKALTDSCNTCHQSAEVA